MTIIEDFYTNEVKCDEKKNYFCINHGDDLSHLRKFHSKSDIIRFFMVSNIYIRRQYWVGLSIRVL